MGTAFAAAMKERKMSVDRILFIIVSFCGYVRLRAVACGYAVLRFYGCAVATTVSIPAIAAIPAIAYLMQR